MFNRRQEKYYPLCLQFFYSLSRLAYGNLPGKSMNAQPDSLQHQSSFLWHPEEEEQGEVEAHHRPGGMVDFIDTDTSDSIDKCTLHSVLCTLIPLTPSQATT